MKDRTPDPQGYLDFRILVCVREHRGCSDDVLRQVIGARAEDVDAAVQALLKRGLLEDRGEPPRRAYHLTRKGSYEWGRQRKRVEHRLVEESQHTLDLDLDERSR